MPKTVSSLAALSAPLIAQFNFFCEEKGLVGLVQADLLCVRCSSNEIYDARRTDAESVSEFIYQSFVSGRRVSLIKFTKSIPTIVGNIDYLELCDQKPDQSQVDAISHIAVVPITMSYEEVLAHLRSKDVEVEETVRPHYVSADIRLPSGFVIRLAKEFLVDKVKEEIV